MAAAGAAPVFDESFRRLCLLDEVPFPGAIIATSTGLSILGLSPIVRRAGLERAVEPPHLEGKICGVAEWQGSEDRNASCGMANSRDKSFKTRQTEALRRGAQNGTLVSHSKLGQ